MSMSDLYTVSIKGKEVFTDIRESEYLDLLDQWAIEFYQTGTPHPDDITFTTRRSNLNE